MILATNDVHPRTQPVAHIQNLDRPAVADWKTRGHALCGIEMLPPNFTWSPVPPQPEVQTIMKRQGWSVCVDCVLALL